MSSKLVDFLRSRIDADKQWATDVLNSGRIDDHSFARRTLAEADSKSRVIKQAFRYEAKIDGEWGCNHDVEAIEAGRCLETNPDDIHLLRLLALPYADHPAYQPEWAPDDWLDR